MGSSYVCRVRDNSRYEVLEDRPLRTQATARITLRTLRGLADGSSAQRPSAAAAPSTASLTTP